MRFDGTLTKWNDDRGFGFITPIPGGHEVFAHISAFPRGARPSIGEAVSFEVEMDRQGKKRAVNIRYPGRPSAMPVRPQPAPRPRRERTSILGRIGLIAVVASLAYWGSREYSRHTEPQSFATHEAEQSARKTEKSPAVPAYRCDGRTHCSQMTSCEEAKYFLRNCPGVEMDGNNDGVPCERQWCTGIFGQ